MKILRPLLVSFSLLVSMASTTAHAAVTGHGTIEVIRGCPTFNDKFRTVTIFQLSDGKWFGLRNQERSIGRNVISSNSMMSVLLLAYSRNESISVSSGYGLYDACGQTDVNFLWNHADDYLETGSDR